MEATDANFCVQSNHQFPIMIIFTSGVVPMEVTVEDKTTMRPLASYTHTKLTYFQFPFAIRISLLTYNDQCFGCNSHFGKHRCRLHP